MRLKEFNFQKSKAKTPQQQRIATLQIQKDNASKALKVERDRQTVDKAQKQIAKVRNQHY